MKNILLALFIVMIGFMFMSCEKNIVGPSKNTTTVVFKLNKSGVGNHGNLFFEKNIHLLKGKPQKLMKANSYDAVKLMMLDMTKFNTAQDFEDFWDRDSTGQQLFNTSKWDSTQDVWDYFTSVLRGYTGSAYEYVGDYTFSILDSVAKGTVYVNPGLNYYLYAFRQSGKTDYNTLIGNFVKIVPDTVNTITLNGQGYFGNTVPDVPSLTYPQNNATGVLLNSYLEWYSYGASTYTLQISKNSTFTNLVFNQSGLQYDYQDLTGLTANTTYYWRVSAENSYGTSGWSVAWQFATGGGTASPCAGVTSVVYSGKTYNTVEIGSQCWLKENLDVGTMIDSLSDQTNNSTIEKYCYSNNPNNCTTYGGLYQWAEAVQYQNGATNLTSPSPAFSGNVQGICPSGWHMPTNVEFQTLTTEVSSDGNSLKAVGQGTGQGAGTNTSGFSALLAGCRHPVNVYFFGISQNAFFWSSTDYTASVAYNSGLISSDNSSGVAGNDKASGFSVRCVKD